jgi:hypothetical protein
MDAAKGDKSKSSALLARVLRDVTDILAESEWAGDFIPRQDIGGARALVNKFSKKGFKEWEDALQQGVKHGDWEGIFQHRTPQKPI